MNMMIPLCERTEPDSEVGISPPRPASILFTDEERFCDWIAHAAPGASTVYFRGHLAYDRMPSTNTFREPKRKRLVAVARRAMQAAEDGLLHLVHHCRSALGRGERQDDDRPIRAERCRQDLAAEDAAGRGDSLHRSRGWSQVGAGMARRLDLDPHVCRRGPAARS